MAFFRNILSSKRVGVDSDMEAGNNRSDVELTEIEAGSGSAHYPNSLNPDSMHMSPGPTFPQTTLPNVAFPQALLPPSQISSRVLNINRKRSHSEVRTSKVRVVEQGSKISTIREIGKRYQVAFERTAMEHQGIADEWLNRAEQQLAEAKRRADEAAKQMEEVKVREEAIRIQAQMMAKHSEELSVVAIARAEKAEQVAAEKVRESIARAEIAEQHSAQKIGEVEKRVQTAVEYAVQLEQKFTDAMKRMEGSTTIERMAIARAEKAEQAAAEKVRESIARAEIAEQHSAQKINEVEKRVQTAVEYAVQLEQKFTDAMKRVEGSTSIERIDMDVASDADARRYVPNKDRRSENWIQWRSQTEDEDLDGEDVENLLQPRAEIAESSDLTRERNEDREHSEGNVPGSTEDVDDIWEDRGITAVRKEKQKMVPPPRKFSRPSGGARSVTFQTKPAGKYRVQSVASPRPSFIPTNRPSASPAPLQPYQRDTNQSSTSPAPFQPYQHDTNQSASSPEPFQPYQHRRQRGKTSQKYSKPIFGEDAEEPRSSTRPSQAIYRQSTLRGFATTRAAQLTAVRESMNRLMDIAKDKDISRVDCATEEEVERFEEGTTTGPDLYPMRPYLNSIRHTGWNDALCDLFVDHFEEEEGIELTPDNKTRIENMFLDRLSRLVRSWRECHKFSAEELYERKLESNKKSRRNTRRVDLYHGRLAICYGNVRNRDGTINQGWKITTEMVEELGPAGMSSDDSELDEETKRTTYKIRRRLWRARECKDRLMVIDSDRNVTNAHGGTRPGNPPRERIRTSTSTISERAPKVGCPKNYYSREWVSNVESDRMVRALKWKEKKDLGSVQDD